jgi:hypothetical protein
MKYNKNLLKIFIIINIFFNNNKIYKDKMIILLN